jgi:gas vesicle protein
MNRNLKKVLTAAEIAAGTGLYLLEHSGETKRKIRQFLGDQVDDLRDRAKDTYESAADRAADLSKGFRNDDSDGSGWNVLRFMVGLGIGVGIGFLMAPASGEDTRAKLTEKAQEFGDNVRQRFSHEDLGATGTGD